VGISIQPRSVANTSHIHVVDVSKRLGSEALNESGKYERDLSHTIESDDCLTPRMDNHVFFILSVHARAGEHASCALWLAHDVLP